MFKMSNHGIFAIIEVLLYKNKHKIANVKPQTKGWTQQTPAMFWKLVGNVAMSYENSPFISSYIFPFPILFFSAKKYIKHAYSGYYTLFTFLINKKGNRGGKGNREGIDFK